MFCFRVSSRQLRKQKRKEGPSSVPDLGSMLLSFSVWNLTIYIYALRSIGTALLNTTSIYLFLEHDIERKPIEQQHWCESIQWRSSFDDNHTWRPNTNRSNLLPQQSSSKVLIYTMLMWVQLYNVFSGSDRSHFGIGSKPFWDQIEAILGSDWSHFGIGSKPSLDRIEAIFGLDFKAIFGLDFETIFGLDQMIWAKTQHDRSDRSYTLTYYDPNQ